MPNRFVQRNGSMVELLTRVPVNRGSLLKSIDNLLKTIETSENAVMIPTLLKDKVRVDAWELLFVAKILKASILGHSDLVEFYLNHIGHTSSSLQSAATTTTATTPNGSGHPHAPATNGQSLAANGELLSPSIRLQTSPMASPQLIRQQQQQNGINATPSNGSSTQTNINHDQRAGSTSVGSSLSTGSTTTSGASSSAGQSAAAAAVNGGAATSARSSNGSISWMSAQQSITPNTSGGSLSSASSATSRSSASETPTPTTPTTTPTTTASLAPLAGPIHESPDEQLPSSQQVEAQEALLATASKSATALNGRQAQPPSLLQLTTTNNHIQSMSDMFGQGSQQQLLSPSLEQLTNQLVSLQQQSQVAVNGLSAGGGGPTTNGHLSLAHFEGLSISTGGPAAVPPAHSLLLDHFGSAASTPVTANGGPPTLQTGATLRMAPNLNAGAPTPAPATATPPPTPRQELRSSRSVGCLFRANSGASSPRTPNQTTPSTPYPQAETLAGINGPHGLVGDPSSLVKLLLQVEQLKASISHCTTLLESVVELYKKSIDNIAQ